MKMTDWRLTKNNCEDIAFANSCLRAGVVSFDEFKQWLYLVVETTDDIPNFVWDIVDLDEKFDFIPLKLMGFNPHWDHTSDEDDAVDGIGYKRSADFLSDASSRSGALEKLSANPHIEDRFRKTFPFIDLAQSPLQLPCHIHQLQLNRHPLDQILEFFVGIIQIDGIAFAEVGLPMKLARMVLVNDSSVSSTARDGFRLRVTMQEYWLNAVSKPA